jgi:hypothetical protein
VTFGRSVTYRTPLCAARSSLVFHHLTRAEKLSALRAIRRLLTEGGELHLADWSAPHDIMMRVAFLAVQALDGFETTGDNIRGELPGLMQEAGFRKVQETDRQRTPLGSMSPERAPSGLLVRTPSIGGAENAAYFAYSPSCSPVSSKRSSRR